MTIFFNCLFANKRQRMAMGGSIFILGYTHKFDLIWFEVKNGVSFSPSWFIVVVLHCLWCCYCAVCQRWTSRENTNFAQGQGNSASTVQECQTACVNNPQCNGLDWVGTNAVGEQCWLTGHWSGARGNVQGVTHYFLDRNCQGKLQHFDVSCIYLRTSQFVRMFLPYVVTSCF